jgi:hypothetical protein
MYHPGRLSWAQRFPRRFANEKPDEWRLSAFHDIAAAFIRAGPGARVKGGLYR